MTIFTFSFPVTLISLEARDSTDRRTDKYLEKYAFLLLKYICTIVWEKFRVLELD